MSRVVVLAIAAASLLSATASWADQPAPSATTPTATPAPATAPAAVDPKSDPNRIVCTREHVVGSNRPQKVCLTVAERERLRDLARRNMDEGRRGNDKTNLGSGGQ